MISDRWDNEIVPSWDDNQSKAPRHLSTINIKATLNTLHVLGPENQSINYWDDLSSLEGRPPLRQMTSKVTLVILLVYPDAAQQARDGARRRGLGDL